MKRKALLDGPSETHGLGNESQHGRQELFDTPAAVYAIMPSPLMDSYNHCLTPRVLNENVNASITNIGSQSFSMTANRLGLEHTGDVAVANKKRGASQSKSPMSDATKAEIERKANELIETALKSKYVEPPPKEPKFNYVIGLSTKWHSRYFYFVATYACPGPNAISPTFEVNFARLEPTATGRFNLAFMRHTEKWQELFTDLTLDECLKSIRDDPWFQP